MTREPDRRRERRALRLMIAMMLILLAGAVGTGTTLTMYVVTGGHHPGWLEACNWIKWGMLACGLVVCVLLARTVAT